MKLSGNGNGKKRDFYSQSKFKRGKQTCVICGDKNDWDCRITEDEGLAYCSFVPNESGKKDIDGRFEYILKTDRRRNLPTTKITMGENSSETVKADAENLNAVYTALLEGLKLKEKHSDELLYRRGLSDSDIIKNLYASVPDFNKRYEIAVNLSKQFSLEGVPGFYLNNKVWCLNMTFSGFYIPYRDEKGRIVGLQIRRDEDSESKYMWVSSSGKSNGTSSGTPLHFVNVEIVKETKVLFLTEGALKADIIGSKEEEIGIVASAGVSAVNPEQLLDSIFSVFPDLERIVIAYDMDWETKEEVRLALGRLLDALKVRKVKVDVAVWDSIFGKGIDDVLLNENFPDGAVKYIPAQEFQANIASNEIKKEAKETTDEIPIAESLETETRQEGFEQEFEQTSKEVNQEDFRENPIMYSWDEFSKLDFEDLERVIFGLVRGNVGLVVASTNLGKTTLALNLALSATAKTEFLPLLNQSHTARKILYIDGEATKAELYTDINKMQEVFAPEQVESVKKNLFLICDEELDDELLDLVNPEHRKVIERKALACNPDLIIVDTLSALMDIEDENDNAKVKKEVMKPLKKLAKQTNSAVLLLHHTGKYNEGISTVGAYKGRGASAFGGLSRTVLNLEKSKSKENRVILSSPKVKGEEFSKTVLELDKNSRWFRVVGEVAQEKEIEKYEQVIEFVRQAQRPVKRKEIKKEVQISAPTLTRNLNRAVKNGDLIQPKFGYYSVPNYREPNQEIPIGE